jgi:hypothetical protein
MSSELITTWSEHDGSLQRILSLVTTTLFVFDEDLSKLKLERLEHADALHRFLLSDKRNRLQIVVKNSEPLRRHCPRLMKLLAVYGQNMSVVECPQHLLSLSDSLLIADEKHALIRFHKDSARSKLILDSAGECKPYANRFEDILKEGGQPVCTSTLGL